MRHVLERETTGRERDERVRGGGTAAREPEVSGWVASTAAGCGRVECGGGLEAGRGVAWGWIHRGGPMARESDRVL